MLVGLDVLRRSRNRPARRRLEEARVGVLTHAPAVDEKGRQTLAVLQEAGIEVSLVFSPEHGLDGLAQAEEPVGTDEADTGGIPVVSVYGSTKDSLTPTREQLGGLDVLVVDVCDVGARYYTYVWSALLAARAAAEAGIHTLILDRPNPLGGNPKMLEGRPQDEGLCSFVGLEPFPIRHSMTVGEIVTSIFNREDRPLGPDGALSVVPTEGWERHRTFEATGRPFVPPSPNMPSLQTALVYPGGCLLEATNLSEGRGTTTPFQLVGAPYLHAKKLAEAVGSVPGAWIRPTRFKPSFDKYRGEICQGVMVHVEDPAKFRPVECYLRIIAAARRLAPDDFQLLDRVYEFESEHSAFDLLTGTTRAREMLLADAPPEELVQLLCPVEEDWSVRVEFAEDLLLEVQS